VYKLFRRTYVPGAFDVHMAGACDPGLARGHNEDAIALQEDDGRGYFSALVCDGMGGYNAGELASATAVQCINDLFQAGIPTDDLDGLVQQAMTTASQKIDEMAAVNSDAEGMGCTAVVILGQRESITLAHVGDSRAYRLRDGRLEQMTKDHTMVQEMLDCELISERQAAEHPYAGRISRCLGHGKRRDEATISHFELLPGDVLMLCSDGLSDVVEPETMLACLDQGDVRQAARSLVDAANRGGGPDNISAVVIRRVL
jgi:protein phosphatase